MKTLFIFVALAIHFAFSTKFLNASGFNESYSLRGGLSTVNEAGIIFYKMEIFKDIKGYEEYYQISNLGNVKSFKRGKNKIRKVSGHKDGYLHVVLSKNGITNTKTIHRLIAIHFIPNLQNKPEINHKNGIKADNRVENLEWCTSSENQLHAIKNGLQKIQRGSQRGRVAKLNEVQVKEIRSRIDKKESQKDLAKEFNISEPTISMIKTNKIWLHV